MRALILSSSILIAFAFVIVVLHPANYAHAGEPTHCGFWTSIEAGLSCR